LIVNNRFTLMILSLFHTLLIASVGYITPIISEQQANAQNTTSAQELNSSNKPLIDLMTRNLTDVVSGMSSKVFNNVTSPSIVISPENNTIYLSYSKTENNKTNIYLVNSTDGGESFSPPVRVNNIAGDATKSPWTSTKIVLGPNNEIYVLWQVIDESNKEFKYGTSSLRLAKSLDGGATFLPTTRPANDTVGEKAFFDLAVSKNNSLFITYLDSFSNVTNYDISYPSEAKLLRSFDGGQSFEGPIVIDETSCDCCKTAAVTADNNEVYILWRHANHTAKETYSNGSNPYNYEDKLGEGVIYEVIRDIYITHSNDSGKAESFVPAIRIHADNWYMNGCPSAGPALGFDSKGVLHVSWFTGGGAMPGTYYANSTDSGNNFSKPLPVLADKWVPQSQSNLAIDGNDNVWMAITDGRNDTNNHVFVAVKTADGRLLKNQLFGIGEDPMISSGTNLTGIVWTDKDKIKLAVMDLK
jgi:hypothetical protein